MPLQPPNPEFLSAAPDPEGEGPGEDDGEQSSGWRRPAELTGVGFVVLAAIVGAYDLIS
jgi:hypothetical protein